MGLGCVVVDSCSCHMPAANFPVTSRTTYTFFSTFVCGSVNVAVHKSSHSSPMDISALYWRWGEMCDVSVPLYNKGLRFSYALLVSCVRLPYGSMTCSPFCVLTLFTQGVSTLV